MGGAGRGRAGGDAYQSGAARITLERYRHVLPGELEHARKLLDKFLAERASEEDPLTVSRR